MTEDYLHYLWKFQLLDKKDLKCAQGQMLQVVKPGYYNRNSGPDFSEAKLYIDEQLWAGQVEVHLRSSDWYRHFHQRDAAYQAVVLHVVYEHDREVFYDSGEPIPTLELKGRISEEGFWKVERLLQNSIPCKAHLVSVDPMTVQTMIERCFVERIEDKVCRIRSIIEDLNGDWEESFYQVMAYAYGLKLNADPMIRLSKSIPTQIWLKYVDDERSIFALFFGSAGWLTQAEDSYTKVLRREWNHLKHKYQLGEMEVSSWKWSRLRPPAFIHFRTALFCSFLIKNRASFSLLLKMQNLQEIRDYLQVKAPSYWTYHYKLGAISSKKHPAHLGMKFIDIVIINVVLPIMFLYAKQKGLDGLVDRSMNFYRQLQAESNFKTKKLEQAGFDNKSAADSQALIHLFDKYCSQKKCLHCQIGVKIVNLPSTDRSKSNQFN